ncbi:topoisomerase [Sporosarcina sp. ACRSM]|uniref:topoisomerase n=1 Tax=Sporosarcina sp. ACRSM TaxID=2918216 RepID=UPI001EF44506|nr:topoisomerase [Sporosarcina sp. ACRSM]MCG7333798.1 topoisomerase [Sporosarcina sp. ACRSM]
MMKQAIISGVVFSSILLVGCNGNESEEPVQVLESEQDVVESEQEKLLSELRDEIIVSITEQTAIEADSIAIMLGGNVKELSVSVSFPKNVKVDDTLIQQVVEDSIKKVSETDNVTISEENITIKIEKY